MVLKKRQQKEPQVTRFGKRTYVLDSDIYAVGPFNKPMTERDTPVADNVRENSGKFWTQGKELVYNETYATIDNTNVSPTFGLTITASTGPDQIGEEVLKLPKTPAFEPRKKIFEMLFDETIVRSSQASGTKFGTQTQNIKLEAKKRFFERTVLTRRPADYNQNLWKTFITGDRSFLNSVRQREIGKLRVRLEELKAQRQELADLLELPPNIVEEEALTPVVDAEFELQPDINFITERQAGEDVASAFRQDFDRAPTRDRTQAGRLAQRLRQLDPDAKFFTDAVIENNVNTNNITALQRLINRAQELTLQGRLP